MNNFTIKADGLYYKEEFISDFWPVVTSLQLFVTPTERAIRRNYLISIHLADGRTLKTHSFSSIKVIPYFEVWYECRDALLTERQKKFLYSYLQEQVANLPMTKTYYLPQLGLYSQGLLYSREQMILVDPQKAFNYMPSPELPDFPCPKVKKKS